jgi:hypothetical protein
VRASDGEFDGARGSAAEVVTALPTFWAGASWLSIAVRSCHPWPAQWAVLQPLLPVGRKSGRPPKWSKRQLIDGIRWRVRVGTRDLVSFMPESGQ